ncbi:hypothetical protein L5515_014366 [Caenorhabditis briggsae]|uniref:Uncharacterized protein n=1 Tax=Caenorhabditis briggsae TaxID=6238 RepID=A0AAE9EE47_CAEBR|nr:hypothetical protein L5515_014366 [Caenorhabditis briggsae]
MKMPSGGMREKKKDLKLAFSLCSDGSDTGRCRIGELWKRDKLLDDLEKLTRKDRHVGLDITERMDKYRSSEWADETEKQA